MRITVYTCYLLQWNPGLVSITEGDEETRWREEVQMGHVLLPQILEVTTAVLVIIKLTKFVVSMQFRCGKLFYCL